MAEEQLNHTEPLVPSHLEIALEVMLEKQGPQVSLSPEGCHTLLGGARHAEYFTEQLAVM